MRKKQGHYTVEANNLIYYPREQNIKIKVKGKWALSRTHDLIFIVDRSMSERFGETISLRTKIEKAGSNQIAFKAIERRTPLGKEIKRIYLDGTWRMDTYHRLRFAFKKDKQSQELLFRNEWQITKDNQLIYRYRRNVKKREVFHAFVLTGQWEFNGRTLKYKIDGTPDSSLNIKISQKKTACDPKQKRIDFEYGFGYERKDKVRVKKRTFSLFGTWKIYSHAQVGFVVSYPKNKEVMWVFPIEIRHRKNRLEISIKKRKGQPVKTRIACFKELGSNKELFLSLQRTASDIDARLGLNIIF